MFKKMLDDVFDFYFWETVDPENIPKQLHSRTKDGRYYWCILPKQEIMTIREYDSWEGRFLSNHESQSRLTEKEGDRLFSILIEEIRNNLDFNKKQWRVAK